VDQLDHDATGTSAKIPATMMLTLMLTIRRAYHREKRLMGCKDSG